MKKVLFILIILLLLAAFGISAFMIGSYLLDGKEQEELYDDLSEIVANAGPTTSPTVPGEQTPDGSEPVEATNPPTHDENGILLKYSEIYAMNPDTVGWLTLEGTELDYPVMQTPEDPQYYLYKNFLEAGSTRGSIFAWGEADINKPSDNITLFGHNMKDGSMFAALNAYVDIEAWYENSIIRFDTIYEEHTYQIFAVFKTPASVTEGFRYHQFVDAANEAEFNEFVATCKDLAFYDTGLTPKYGDKLLCLSTCEYSLENGRLVVCAYRLD